MQNATGEFFSGFLNETFSSEEILAEMATQPVDEKFCSPDEFKEEVIYYAVWFCYLAVINFFGFWLAQWFTGIAGAKLFVVISYHIIFILYNVCGIYYNILYYIILILYNMP